MKKTSTHFKPDNQSSKLIESLRQSYKNKDIIQKANNYANRGISETKISSQNNSKNAYTRPIKKSEEPGGSRITEENLMNFELRNKSKERKEKENSNNNNVIKIKILYNNYNKNQNSNSNLLRESGNILEKSNCTSKNTKESNKLNIVGGLIINANNNMNISPKEIHSNIPASNYSKFAHNSKHVKAKSISSNRGILSSLNLLKSKKNNNKSKNESTNNIISYENTNENLVKNSNNKSSQIVFLDNNIIINDHPNRGHIRNNSSNVNFNNNLNSSFNNINNGSQSNAKSTNKGSTTSSITKGIPNNHVIKPNEIESPEELHYFYLNLYIQNKNLAYKFENLNFSGEEFQENSEI